MARRVVMSPGGERGAGLLEALVSLGLLAIVLTVALVLFASLRRASMRGESLSDLQQATRVGFERLVSDIRLAGFNCNPRGGDPGIDESIEGAWDTAITIRADFDGDDPSARAEPEESLSRGGDGFVSTGNDEIVSYVLAKPGPRGPDELVLRLDADNPRSGTARTVIIPNIGLRQDDPPYTLYRVTLTNPPGAFPSPPQRSASFVFEPVADGLRSLRLRYYDGAGILLNPATPGDAADDIGGADDRRALRARIRRIAVELVGMNLSEGAVWSEPEDGGRDPGPRKWGLRSSVTPLNLTITAPPATFDGAALSTGAVRLAGRRPGA